MNSKKDTIKNTGRIALTVGLSAIMALAPPLAVLAETYYAEDGYIRVVADANGQTVSQNFGPDQPDESPVISNRDPETPVDGIMIDIWGRNNTPAQVTFKDLNVTNADVLTDGETVIELDGTNSIQADRHCAGLNTSGGSLTINDANHDGGSLYVEGGPTTGAGIGGGIHCNGQNITITGGTITAIGHGGAGIGGGAYSNNTSNITRNITITGGTITAIGYDGGAGIGGGGIGGDVTDITITGGTVTAIGSNNGTAAGAAGIGGGGADDLPGAPSPRGNGNNITIGGSAKVSAAGGTGGVAIGGRNGEVYDTAGLYDTGYIRIYAPGTTAETLATSRPVNTTVGTIPDPEAPAVPVTVSVPSQVADVGSSQGSATAPANDFDAFMAQLDVQIEAYLQQLAALIATGRLDLLQDMINSGFSINLGNITMLDAKTCNLLVQVLGYGVPVKIDYTNGGVNYKTTISPDAAPSLTTLSADGICTIEELMGTFATQTL